MTDFHNLNTPSEGTADWHIPLNENFNTIDSKLEIRDTEANLSSYSPKAGAKFLATNTGNTYLGDGNQWVKRAITGHVGAQLNRAFVYQDAGDVVAIGMNGSEIDRAASGNAGTIINRAYDYVSNNYPNGSVVIATGEYEIDETIQLDAFKDYGLYGMKRGHRGGAVNTTLRATSGLSRLIEITQQRQSVIGMELSGKTSGGSKQNTDLIYMDGGNSSRIQEVGLEDTLGYGMIFLSGGDTWMSDIRFSNCGSQANDTVAFQAGDAANNRNTGFQMKNVKGSNLFGANGDGSDAATCVRIENNSDLVLIESSMKIDGAANVPVCEIAGNGSRLKATRAGFTSTTMRNAPAIHCEGVIISRELRANSCKYGIHLDSGDNSVFFEPEVVDNVEHGIYGGGSDCMIVGGKVAGNDTAENGNDDIHLSGGNIQIFGGRIGIVSGVQARHGIWFSKDNNRVIGAKVGGASGPSNWSNHDSAFKDCFNGSGNYIRTELQGKATFSGDGSSTTFTISDPLDVETNWADVTPDQSTDATDVSGIGITNGDIEIEFSTAPSSGTGNVQVFYEAKSFNSAASIDSSFGFK